MPRQRSRLSCHLRESLGQRPGKTCSFPKPMTSAGREGRDTLSGRLTGFTLNETRFSPDDIDFLLPRNGPETRRRQADPRDQQRGWFHDNDPPPHLSRILPRLPDALQVLLAARPDAPAKIDRDPYICRRRFCRIGYLACRRAAAAFPKTRQRP